MSKLKFQNYISKLKIVLVILILNFALLTFNLSEAHAQTPANWQNNATGLRTATNSLNKTAGLTTTVKVGNSVTGGIPFMQLQGGVRESYSAMIGPSGIDLGQIKSPGVISATLNSESADWAHNQIVFGTNLGNQINILISRLSPAILIQNATNSLRLFSGNLTGATADGSTITNRAASPAYPKYIAYQSSGTVRVQAIPASGATTLSLPVLDNNWVLVWYGNNSHFAETKLPISYGDEEFGYASNVLPTSQAYQADAPMLLKFQNNPTSIKQTSEGGIDLTFGTNSGYTSMMPLFGRERLRSSDTEGWGSSGTLPANVISKINFWNTNNRLCSYPTTVLETYAPYDSATDISTITENLTYLNICSGGSATSGFAILPPTLALAKDAIGANITGTLVDANYPTEFGPIIGIDNTNTYSWSVTGLKKYTDSRRVLTNSSGAPADLVSELTSEINKTTLGHFKPWMFLDRVGESYFMNPGDVIYQLSEISPALPEPQKTNLVNYIKNEKTAYPPETVYNLPNTGTTRFPASDTNYSQWQVQYPYAFYKRVPLYNMLALSSYYDLTKELIPAGVISAAKTALNNDMAEQDWASFSWFKDFSQNHTAVVATNRHLDGLIGFVRLMKAVNDSSESLGRALFTKAAIARIAMVKYPRYLYTANLTIIPVNQPDWQPVFTRRTWQGYLYNYNWTNSYDDAQQVALQDQFGTYLYDHTGFIRPGIGYNGPDWICCAVNAQLSAYLDLAPEGFRLLTDYAKQDFEIYLNKATTLIPHWYQAFAEAVFGMEHGIVRPPESMQLFLAKTLIQNDTPQNLRTYLDIPWLTNGGDFFYSRKLAETIKAYQGWAWSDTLTLGPCTISSLSWSSNNAVVGDLVDLRVSATGNCSQSTVTFEVDQNGFLGGKMTDPTPKTRNFTNNQSFSTWTTEYTPKVLGDPEYYFKVSLDNGTTWSNNSSFLTVSQAPTPTPTPTSTPVVTPTPTSTPSSSPSSSPSSTPAPTGTPGPITTVFSDNFESGNLSSWTTTSILGTGSTLNANAASARSSSYGMNAFLPATAQGNRASVYRTVSQPASRQLWGKVDVNLRAPLTTQTVFLAWYDQSPVWGSIVEVSYNSSTSRYRLGVRGLDGNYIRTDFSSNPTSNTWQTWKWSYDWSSTPITASLWINGTRVAQVADSTTGTFYLPQAAVGIQDWWNGVSLEAYFDNVSIYNADPDAQPTPTPTPTPQPTATPSPISATISLNPATTYQTMIGWEATDYDGADDHPTTYPLYRNVLYDQLINDVGINRIRLEIRSGVENSRDYYTEYRNGQISYSDWRCYRYSTVNDNSDPNTINPAGYQFSDFDKNINNIVIPMKQRLEARGEKLHINLNYVAFTGQIVAAGCPAGLTYIHNQPAEYAEFMLATFQHMQQKYGFVPDTIEVILEPDNVSQWNNGTIIGNAINATIARLEAAGFTPRFVVPSTTSMASAPVYFDAIVAVLGAQRASQYITELSYHRYTGVNDGDLQEIANRSIQYGIGASMLEWWDPNNTYQILQKDLKLGRNTAWQQGTVLGVLDVNETNPANPVITVPDQTKYDMLYYKFIRSGAQRIDATSQNANFDPIAFINKNGTYVVVVNASAGGNFSIGGLPAGTYGIKYTISSTQYNIDLTDQTITAGQNISTNIPSAGVITIYDKNYLTPIASPTPSPTPTPVPCTLASAAWSTTTTTEGSTVNLNVSGDTNCAGKQVNFEVRRNGTLLDDIPANIQPQTASISASLQASTTWVAERTPLWPFTDAQYYFRATPQGGATIDTKPQLLTVTSGTVQTGPQIASITDNSAAYPNSQIPKYEKFELTFQINNSVAKNFQMPYDANPPAGVTPGQGITVNAQFSQDNFATYSTQPAFYYQDFDYQVKGNRDWIYPTNNFSWKVRFSPNKEGTWQYRLIAQDASGTVTSPTQTFTVTSNPNNHGFVKVSQKDKRYFEYEDGTYFPGLGYNMNFDQISWNNPVLDNQNNFQIMNQNGIQLIRAWLPQWGIFSTTNNPWRSFNRGADFDWYLHSDSRVPSFTPYPGSDVSLVLQWQYNHSEFLGWMKNGPAVKPNTTYHVSVRYLIPTDLTGPRTAGQPYGLAVKTANTWIDTPQDVGIGTKVTSNVFSSPKNTSGSATWSTLEGSFTTAAGQNFLPFLYLTLENVTDQFATGGGIFAYIDKVEVKEDLGGGTYGVNIIDKSSMDMHKYFGQEYSYRFDKVLDLAKQNNIYFKLVGLEKNDQILDSIGYDGTFGAWDSTNAKFYGNWGSPTMVYWLQQAFWRYMQARWGYSTNIQSWELLNEGDPNNGLHWTLANNYAKYMHQFGTNSHLTTTSLWGGFPASQFWGSSSYPDIDYADIHQYIPKNTNSAGFNDPALDVFNLSNQIGAKTAGGVNKPTIRGETGLTDSGTQPGTNDVLADTQGIWLHKFIWGQINAGGVLESGYWYPNSHIYDRNYIGSTFDHRDQFGKYYNFIKDIPLSNGNYKEASASASNTNIRAWGQKDTVNGKAHLWIDNKTHTWGNVVNNPSAIATASGTVTIPNMPAGTYTASWFDTYAGTVSRTENVTPDTSGNITLNITNLSTDTAVKLDNQSITPSPTPTGSGLPTSTPTPTPVPCTFTANSALWSTTTIPEASSVNLTVTGNSSCIGQTVNFNIKKNNLLLDQDITTLTATFSATLSAATSWTTPAWFDDCGGIDPRVCNPSYHFDAVSGSNSQKSNDLTVTQATTIPTSPTDWPQVQKDPQHTGYSNETLGTNFKVAWTYPFQPERIHNQVQAIVYQGKVFVGTENGNMYAINAGTGAGAGQQTWKFVADGPIINSVAANDNKVFFGTLSGSMYAVDTATGQQVWRQQLLTDGGFSAAPIIGDNKILIGGQDGYFYALDPNNGQILWRYNTGSPVFQTAAYDQGKVFFGAQDMFVYGLNTSPSNTNDPTTILAWKSQKLRGMALREYWPVVYQGKVFIRPQGDTLYYMLGITPNLDALGGNLTWLSQWRTTIATGGASLVPDIMNAQNTAITNYQTNPNNYVNNSYILDENSGQIAQVVPHWFAQTHAAAVTPPCVDREGKLIIPLSFTGSGWGRLDLSIGRIVDILYDGYDPTTGNIWTQSPGQNQYPSGFGNGDEDNTVSCSNNLILSRHTHDSNSGGASWNGYFNLDSHHWTPIAKGYTNNQMSNNLQAGRPNPFVISNSMIYDISFHELVARTTQ